MGERAKAATKCQTCEGSGVVIVWRGKAIATCDDCQGSGENGRSEP